MLGLPTGLPCLQDSHLIAAANTLYSYLFTLRREAVASVILERKKLSNAISFIGQTALSRVMSLHGGTPYTRLLYSCQKGEGPPKCAVFILIAFLSVCWNEVSSSDNENIAFVVEKMHKNNIILCAITHIQC